MISVIIASANPNYLASITASISKTIGVEHEIIAFKNSDGAKGICDLYNQGNLQAKYDIVCYVHEDVEFLTPNWGDVVGNIFALDESIGAIGVAGCSYKSQSPSGWVSYGLDKILHFNLIQSFKFSSRPKEHLYSNPTKKNIVPVACIDGVWMCAKKSIALACKFDNELLKGFHGYDVDFSLAVGRQYRVVVTYDILLNHFSEGHFGREWIEAMLAVSAKWFNTLPADREDLTKAERRTVEKKTLKAITRKMIDLNYPKNEIWAMLWAVKSVVGIATLFKLGFYSLTSKNT